MAADIPDLEVHVGEGNGCDVLADRGNSVPRCGGGGGFALRPGKRIDGGIEEGFYLREEGGFAGVVKAKEEDGVFWGASALRVG